MPSGAALSAGLYAMRPGVGGETVDISGTDHTCTQRARGICCGTTGTLKVDLLGEDEATDTVTFPSGALAAGSIHPLAVTKVYKVGTSMADMVVIW